MSGTDFEAHARREGLLQGGLHVRARRGVQASTALCTHMASARCMRWRQSAGPSDSGGGGQETRQSGVCCTASRAHTHTHTRTRTRTRTRPHELFVSPRSVSCALSARPTDRVRDTTQCPCPADGWSSKALLRRAAVAVHGDHTALHSSRVARAAPKKVASHADDQLINARSIRWPNAAGATPRLRLHTTAAHKVQQAATPTAAGT